MISPSPSKSTPQVRPTRGPKGGPSKAGGSRGGAGAKGGGAGKKEGKFTFKNT